MSTHDIIVVGASAGGLEALKKLAAGMPPNFAGTVFIVWHISPEYPSLLPEILNRAGPLPAAHARDKEAVCPGRIYVAPPDYHLVLEDSRVCLYHGPKENHARPAADALFRSAAEVYGERVVGVVLSGMLFDGAAGLITIKCNGGVTIVQDPSEARFSSMPRSAINRDHPDYIQPVAEIAATIRRLAQGKVHATAR